MGTIQEDAPWGNREDLPATARPVYTRKIMKGRPLLLALAALAAGCAGTMTTRQVPVSIPTPATLTGDLFTPAGAGPFPAVILLHGCAGLNPNVLAWSQWLQRRGYAALALDSFRGRGLRNLCGNSGPLPGWVRANDIFAAADALRAVRTVDSSRIAAIGFSHGGWTVLWASRLQARYPETPLKALIAFYPFCGDQRALGGTAPLLMLLAGRDNWTLAEPCERMADGAKQSGRPLELVLYPDARHAFDNPQIRGRVLVAGARGGRGATVEYNPKAHEDSEKQVRQFLSIHLD